MMTMMMATWGWPPIESKVTHEDVNDDDLEVDLFRELTIHAELGCQLRLDILLTPLKILIFPFRFSSQSLEKSSKFQLHTLKPAKYFILPYTIEGTLIPYKVL